MENYEKKYKDALERARANYKADKEMGFIENCDMLELIFPELKESEDEKIRDWLITQLRNNYKGNYWATQAIAWLEKQKETSKAIEAVDRIDKYIDEHLANAHDMKNSNPDKKYYRGWDDALGKMAGILQDVYSGEKQKEPLTPLAKALSDFLKNDFEFFARKEWDEAKWNEVMNTQAMELQRLAYLDEQKEHNPRLIGEDSVEKKARQMYETGQTIEEQKPVEWTERHIADVFEKVGLSKIVREQGNDDLTNALQSAMIELASPVEWSEEDERMLKNVLFVLESYVSQSESAASPSLITTYPTYYKEIDWLKSLRPSWKPSEEQMEALKKVTGNAVDADEYYPALATLYYELKEQF